MKRILMISLVLMAVGARCVFAATCDINQYLYDGKCVGCVYNATCDGEKYICNDGFYDDGNNQCMACPANSTCVSSTDFSCVPGTFLYNGSCTACLDNATCAGGQEPFHCNPGWYNSGSGCRSCDGQICEGETLVSCVEGYFYYNWNGIYCSKCDKTLHCPAGTTIATVSCIEGYYKSSYHCYQCPDEYYCPDSTATIDNYKQYCGVGFYKNGGTCAPCPDGVVCPGHKLHKCPDGLFWHDDGQCLTYAPGDAGIAPNCNPGFYDNNGVCESCPVENSTCKSVSDFDCVAGFYKNGVQCDVCPAYSTCPPGSTQINCIPGYWLNRGKCSWCYGVGYCNDNVFHPCPEFVARSLESVLPPGHRFVNSGDIKLTAWSENGLFTKATDCRVLGELLFETPDGFYVVLGPVWNGEMYWDSRVLWKWTDTPGRYLSGRYVAGEVWYYKYNNACTNAPSHAIYTGAGSPDGNDCPWRCDDGYMRDGNTCTTCPAGYMCINGLIACPAGQYASDKQCLPCPEFYDGRSPDNVAPQSVNQCQIRCDGGTYLANANDVHCTNVGAGYWAADNYTNYGDAGVRNQCPDNLTTVGFGVGADSESDCGRILHVGKYQIYLRSVKTTVPSLAVQVGNRILYGDMTDEKRGHLRTEYNGKIYSVFNADVD